MPGSLPNEKRTHPPSIVSVMSGRCAPPMISSNRELIYFDLGGRLNLSFRYSVAVRRPPPSRGRGFVTIREGRDAGSDDVAVDSRLVDAMSREVVDDPAPYQGKGGIGQ
jgi:hypothetical protein